MNQEDVQQMVNFFELEKDAELMNFYKDVVSGDDVLVCPFCSEDALYLSVNDVKRSQAFFNCLNKECSVKIRVDLESKNVDKI
jgi:transcription elongation factor Elf1